MTTSIIRPMLGEEYKADYRIGQRALEIVLEIVTNNQVDEIGAIRSYNSEINLAHELADKTNKSMTKDLFLGIRKCGSVGKVVGVGACLVKVRHVSNIVPQHRVAGAI